MKFTKLNVFLFLVAVLFIGCFFCKNTTLSFLEPMSNERPLHHHRHRKHKGIPSHQIPPGDEDLYILKSQIVPPVCPACPTNSTCPRQKPCEPCPPCGRCPEPAFECKKVPNYRSQNQDYLPKPILNDFSKF